MRAILAAWRAVVLSGLTMFNASCGTLSSINPFASTKPPVGQPGHVQGFLGAVVADEPRAAVIGRDVLSLGGNAADAATAVGLALTVTLPSRASLGAGGACLAFSPGAKSVNGGVPQAIMFLPRQPAQEGVGADRPAALPMLARGLYLLHARYGNRPFESLVVPAERMARFGIPVSRALANDLSVVAAPLLADPGAAAVFSHNGAILKEGDALVQVDLGATLTQLRVAGVGDLYQGTLARRLARASTLVGGPMTFDDLRRALPTLVDPLIEPWHGGDKVAFLPPPADGGLAAAAAFETLRQHANDLSGAAARALAVAARWRQGGVTAESLLKTADLPEAGLPALPASTTWATLDRDGNAVVCGASLDNLFGTGRIVPGLGFLLAASPASVPPPFYAAALAWNANLQAFRAEVGGSGQAGAPLAVAAAMANTLRSGAPMPAAVPDPGRANVVGCAGYLPGEEGTCRYATDPRGAGLAVGGS